MLYSSDPVGNQWSSATAKQCNNWWKHYEQVTSAFVCRDKSHSEVHRFISDRLIHEASQKDRDGHPHSTTRGPSHACGSFSYSSFTASKQELLLAAGIVLDGMIEQEISNSVSHAESASVNDQLSDYQSQYLFSPTGAIFPLFAGHSGFSPIGSVAVRAKTPKAPSFGHSWCFQGR